MMKAFALGLLALAIPGAAAAESRATLNVAVTVSGDVPELVIKSALVEASMIWAKAGVTIVRRPLEEADVRLVFESKPAHRDGRNLTLGWVEFDDDVPRNEIHVSYGNVLQLVDDWRMANGGDFLNPWAVQMALERALGRALAHEFGHYLLASKAHTKAGLMSARHLAADLFSGCRDGFLIDTALRTMLAERLPH